MFSLLSVFHEVTALHGDAKMKFCQHATTRIAVTITSHIINLTNKSSSFQNASTGDEQELKSYRSLKKCTKQKFESSTFFNVNMSFHQEGEAL